MTESKELKLSSGKMLKVLFMNYGMPWLILAILGMAVFIVLGLTVDLRFFALALIWIFLVIPLLVAFLYFFYGMEPLTTFNSIPHKIIDEDRNIRIRIIREEISESDGSIPEYKDYTVDKADFIKLKYSIDSVILFFSKKGFLWIPSDAFEERNYLQNFLESITRGATGKIPV